MIKPFRFVISSVKVVPAHFSKKLNHWVAKCKVVVRRVFYGVYLLDDLVVWYSEGLGMDFYRFYLISERGYKLPLFLIIYKISDEVQALRNGLSEEDEVVEF